MDCSALSIGGELAHNEQGTDTAIDEKAASAIGLRFLACIAGGTLAHAGAVAVHEIPEYTVRGFCSQLRVEAAPEAASEGETVVGVAAPALSSFHLVENAVEICQSTLWLCSSEVVSATCGMFDAAAAVLDESIP